MGGGGLRHSQSRKSSALEPAWSLVRLRRAINSGKRPPVRQWARAHHGSEVLAHHCGGPETCLSRHLFDGQVGALLFVGVMSLVAEPTRRTLNAIILAGASGVYLSGGFGLWELIYPVIGTVIGFRALQSYRWIAVGWLIHACWDIVHHLWGNPIWPFMPTSAFGCMIFDSMIAVWFLAGAPSFLKRPHTAMRAARA